MTRGWPSAGLTPFTYSRFIVPWLCGFDGWALFLDADILALDDVTDLMDLADDRYALMVSKNRLRFEWPSVMLMNCAKLTMLTPQFVEDDQRILSLDWLDPNVIGAFPGEWNHLVGYDPPRRDAKIVHFTQGTPCWPETKGCEYGREWHAEFKSMIAAQPWETLMGQSVHAAPVRERLARTA